MFPPEPIGLLLAHGAGDGDGDGAEPTFARVVELAGQAEREIRIHMFVWRNDATGNRVAEAGFAAAERGVRIHILKDADAELYERIEMNRKPLFDRPVPPLRRLRYQIIAPTFPDTFVEDDFDASLGEALLTHPNVSLEWVRHTHSKYYVFDGEVIVTGSINLEGRHHRYFDYMAELRGREHVARFDARLAGQTPVDVSRDIEILVNARDPNPRRARSKRFEIKPVMLQLLAGANHSVYAEMAYLGDPDVTRALIDAANRGVGVEVLFSHAANVGNDLNYRTAYHLARRSNGRVQFHVTQKMIHSKLLLVDRETTVLGSANFSIFSLQKGIELDLVVTNHPQFLKSLRTEIAHRIASAEPTRDPARFKPYNRLIANLQQLHQRLP